MPPDDDAALLWDIVEAAKAARRFVRRLSEDKFVHNDLVSSAVERKLEIIGEASRRLSAALRRAHPHIPRRKIIGLRNIVAHDYRVVRHRVLWRVVKVHLPTLLRDLKPLLAAFTKRARPDESE